MALERDLNRIAQKRLNSTFLAEADAPDWQILTGKTAPTGSTRFSKEQLEYNAAVQHRSHAGLPEPTTLKAALHFIRKNGLALKQDIRSRGQLWVAGEQLTRITQQAAAKLQARKVAFGTAMKIGLVFSVVTAISLVSRLPHEIAR